MFDGVINMTDEDLIKIGELLEQLETINSKIKSLRGVERSLRCEITNIYLRPFKVGEVVLYEAPIGSQNKRKWRKCIIEAEFSCGDVSAAIYARLIKNGVKQQRRFFIDLFPITDKEITEIFRKCEQDVER